MSAPLVLVAAGGLAREVLSALADDATEFHVRGLLDDAPDLKDTSVGGFPVLGTVDTAAAHLDARFVVCAGKGSSRAAIVERLGHLGVTEDRYATFVHPRASVPTSCRVGCGSVILAGTVLTADVSVGRHVVAMPHVTLTHDDVVDDFATLCAGVSIGGGVRVGRAAYLGMNSSVREYTTVGSDAVLGMGAALLDDLPAGRTWVGVPARELSTSDSSADHTAYDTSLMGILT